MYKPGEATKRKLKHTTEPPQSPPPGHQQMEPSDALFNPNLDLCQQLLDRYSSSAAAHQRHLCATAAAMRSILLDDSLPLTPLSYFAATITAFSDSSGEAPSLAALSTYLSILLPLVPEGSIAAEKAAEATEILVKALKNPSKLVSTSTMKCMVKCLGVLAGFCDLEDWNSLKLPVETLLEFSVDKRPKVRKCAQIYMEKLYQLFESETVVKEASKLIEAILKRSISLVAKSGDVEAASISKSETQAQPDHSEAAHILGAIRITIPYLPSKVSTKIVSELLTLLRSQSCTVSRLVINIVEAFFKRSVVDSVTQVSEDIVVAVSSYVLSLENSTDTIISAARVLKTAIDKLHADGARKWISSFPLVVAPLAGLLTFEDDTALQASQILRELFHHHLDEITLSLCVSQQISGDMESRAVGSICSIFEKLLLTSAEIPNKHILTVLSVLFLKLGDASSFHMKDIFLKLAELMCSNVKKLSDTRDLQKCIGSAVVAMGPENVLNVVPVSIDEKSLTCSNTWLLPILQKYIVGAPLGYFMDHIVPIAKSFQKLSRKVKKSATDQDLQGHAHALWSLLPAFCRYPVDTTKKFESLAKILRHQIEKDASKHEIIARALQELVKGNKSVKSDIGQPAEIFNYVHLPVSVSEIKNFPPFSKKQAAKNIKILSACSSDLLLAVINVFVSSPTDKRKCLKDAIRCLASISDPSVIRIIFISSLRYIVGEDGETEEPELLDGLTGEGEMSNMPTIDDTQWCLILELASLLVDGASKDLVGVFFKLTKKTLKAGEGAGMSQAYYTLMQILEEHVWFCSSHFDELVDLLLGLKVPADPVSYLGRLKSLQTLLIFNLKTESDAEDTKAFLILNDIILTLKASKEEARKMAYDVLLGIRSKLRDLSESGSDESFHRLINMMTGYLSGPSPHITSGAVSALSLLVYKEPDICTAVADLVPSVLSLLQGKAVEVVKAALGFVKVLVSCQETEHLQNYVSSIVEAVLPWSSCSRHHFRSKVIVILEIMVRKCGSPPVVSVTSPKYKSFLRKVLQNRHGNSMSKDTNSVDDESLSGNASVNGRNEMPRKGNAIGTGSVSREGTKRKWQDRRGPAKQTNSDKPSTGRVFGASKQRKVFHQSPSQNRKRKVDQVVSKAKTTTAAYMNKKGQAKTGKKFKRKK